MTESFSFDAIGHVRSPYKEKFAIPRQPGLVKAARGSIKLNAQFDHTDMVKSIEQFSHLWVVFVFHETMKHGWKPLVRPPRLGGNEKVGVLATRSTFRPNPIGMSVVTLDDVLLDNNSVQLAISGLDLLDCTPVLDIKPYIPYADAIESADGGYANSQPLITKQVTFSDQALAVCRQSPSEENLFELIVQVLSQDPRPAYKHQKADNKIYGIRLYHYNISWQVRSANIEVQHIEKEVE